MPTNTNPAQNAIIWLSGIHFTNILVILIILNNFLRIDILYLNKPIAIIFVAVLTMLLITVNYFQLYKKRDAIAEKFKNENKKVKILGSIVLYFYMIGSIALLYVVSKLFPIIP